MILKHNSADRHGRIPLKFQPDPNPTHCQNHPGQCEIVQRSPELYPASAALDPMAYRILHRGPLHIVSAVDLDLLDLQLVILSLEK